VRIFSIAWKDFRHTYRNIAGLAMMIVAPLLLATALGAAFGAGGSFSIPPIKTALVNEDSPSGSATAIDAGSTIVQTLDSPDLSDLLTITTVNDAQAARDAVDKGEADVAVIIPPGLTDAVTSQQGGRAQVTVFKDPALTVGPAIVSAVVQSVVQAIDGARAAAATAVQLAVSLGVTDPDELTDVATKTAVAFSASVQGEPPITVEARGPVIAGGAAKEPNVAAQVLIGMMIFFMFFGAATPARSILEEHRAGTLSRLFTTPTRRSFILGGKYVAVFLIVLMQSVILLLAGWLFYGAHWGAMGPVIALTLCGAFVAASLGLLTVSFAKTPGQAGAVSSAIFVFLGLAGGNFVGTAGVGGAFGIVRRITPNGWLLEGWEHVLYGGSWDTVYVPLSAALGFSLVFFAIATFFFRRRYA
jgi:ABC-2 type transport system permease protein